MVVALNKPVTKENNQMAYIDGKSFKEGGAPNLEHALKSLDLAVRLEQGQKLNLAETAFNNALEEERAYFVALAKGEISKAA